MSFDLERPDSLLGMMMALEGIRDAMTIIHGPTGCKMYPADLAERLFIDRKDEIETRNPFLRMEKYFFYQPRLPCTLLDGNRLILGSTERLNDLYSIVVGQAPKMIGIVNSPGATLTGEDLSSCRSEIPTVTVESNDFSASMQKGFSEITAKVIDALSEPKKVIKGSVNILGLSIWHLNFEDDVRELERIMSLCGVKVNCVLCAGSSVEEIRNIASAELNIVVDRDFGLRAAEHCRDRFGTPFIEARPIGFDATERLIKETCKILGKDPSEALDDSLKWRRRTAGRISALEKRYFRIRGRTFSVHATPSLADSVAEFMYEYLGIVPTAIQHDGEGGRGIETEIPVSDEIWDVYSDVLFSSGSEIAAMLSRRMTSGGVCICDPDVHPANIFPRPMMGTIGAARLIEDTLNVLIRITDRM